MEAKSLAQVAELAGGLVRGDGSRRVQTISTDSRNIKAEELFWALAGENFDGHSFVVQAAQKGAEAIACRTDREDEVRTRLSQANLAVPLIVMDDTLKGLQTLAKNYRREFSLPVIAITGSAGKTTTKDLTAAVFSQRFQTLKTQGNFNNEIGLPLTLLGLTHNHEALVVEMGMRGIGQIQQLADIAEPTVGVVTNVGPVHLELLGSMEAIASAKGELVEALPQQGTAILNWDDPRVRSMAEIAHCPVMSYGRAPEADLRISDIEVRVDGTKMTFVWEGRDYEAFIPVPGKHNASNAAAAILAGLVCGLSPGEAAEGLSRYEGSRLRMEITRGQDGTVVIDDSYNANPQAMKAAIETAVHIAQGHRIVLVLGDMLELGPLSDSAHRDLGALVASVSADLFVAVGAQAPTMAEAAGDAGLSRQRITVARTASDAVEALGSLEWRGSTVLVKGSRGVGLDQVASFLTSQVK